MSSHETESIRRDENGASAGVIHSTLASDPDLVELVEQLVTAMPDRIESLEQAFDTGNLESLETLSHQLKGTLGSYGFDSLTPVALRLEQSVRSRQPEDEIREALEDLTGLCRRLTAEPEPA